MYALILFQLFALDQVELEELARHMGHELSVHRHFYRLQEDVTELAKISKLLIAVEEGKAHSFKGKALDDINLEGERINLTKKVNHHNWLSITGSM